MIIGNILKIFFFWRIVLFLIAFSAIFFIPTFGERFPYANVALMPTNMPSWIWGFGNFDGVHYLRIAQNGYNAEYSQAFFPLYPLLINIFNVFPKDLSLDTKIFVDPSFFYSGFVLSNIFLIVAVYLFYKLVKIDHNEKISFWSTVLLLTFPTAFYFGAIYTESLFLLLTCACFLSIRKNNFLLAGVFALLASATRIFGLLFLPVLLIEFFLAVKRGDIKLVSKQFIKPMLGILLAPMGLLAYMFYLKNNFNDPLYFLTSQPFFGAERSQSIVLLPQVIFRYFKILTTVSVNSLPFFNAALELIFASIPLIILILLIKKIRLSYSIFTLGILIMPTLTGTFSSMPRYALMSFLIFPFMILLSGRYFKLLIALFIVFQAILLSLFTRGYWVA